MGAHPRDPYQPQASPCGTGPCCPQNLEQSLHHQWGSCRDTGEDCSPSPGLCLFLHVGRGSSELSWWEPSQASSTPGWARWWYPGWQSSCPSWPAEVSKVCHWPGLDPAQLPCGVMNLPALGAPLNFEASRALSVGPPTHCSLEARVYHPGSALGRAGSTAQRGGEGPQGLGDFLPLDPLLFHLLHSCQAEEGTVHQFQASQGLGAGATWSGEQPTLPHCPDTSPDQQHC